MKICGIQNYNLGRNSNSKAISHTSAPEKSRGIEFIKGQNGDLLKVLNQSDLVEIKSISDKKVGSKFLVTFKDPKYKGLKILFKPDSKMKSDKYDLEFKYLKGVQSFKGRVYGSIRKNSDDSCDEKMKGAYNNFWSQGMYNTINTTYINDKLTSQIKDDYNFYIPSDGDGTRYKDITRLQGEITKPASIIPATLNGHNMSLVQGVLSNFTQTSKLDQGVDFIEVEPAKGSAYAFLEGIKDGKIGTDKPLVFSWGDNFSDINITKLILDHEKNNAGFTVLSILSNMDEIQSLGALKVPSKDDLTVSKFLEKPSLAEAREYEIPDKKGYCLGSVGPYVLSKEVLSWIKDNYTANPESFLNPDKGYDFSSMIISPLVVALNNGEIKDEDGNKLTFRTQQLAKNNTWSDLGNEKDFTANMKMVKNGEFSNLPKEMRKSISQNVDRDGNITFSKQGREMLEQAVKEYKLDLKNVISYYDN